MAGLFSRIHTWIKNETVKSADLNAEFNNVINNIDPSLMSGDSADVAEMQNQVNPGSQGSESLAQTTTGEIERLRYVISRMIGGTYWYDTPTSSLDQLSTLINQTNVIPPNRVVSGKTLSASNQPAFLVANGANLKVTLKGASTPFIYYIAGIQYTVSVDVDLTLGAAPSSATASVNDTTLTAQASSQLIGEKVSLLNYDGASSAFQTAASSGTFQSFKIVHSASTEYFYGFVNTGGAAGILSKAFRGFYFDSTSTPVPRIGIADNDVITFVKTYWVFVTTAGALDSTSNCPTVSFVAPSSPATGDYWFDINSKIWKKYNGSSFVASNATIIGIAITDTSNCVASRALDFYAAYSSLNTTVLEIRDNNSVRSTQPSARVNSGGNTYNFNLSLPVWIKPTNFDTGVTDVSLATYYLYMKDTGDVVISNIVPYDRRFDLYGYYHPYNPWRSLGSVTNDSSSHFITLVQDTASADSLISQMSSSNADSIGALMSPVGANSIAASRSRSNGVTVGLGGVGISISSGNFTTSSTSFVNVTGAAQTFGTGNVNTGTGTITITAHGYLTGQVLNFTSTGTLPGGIIASTDYFAIVTGVNTFQIATSLANAVATTPVIVTLTTTGSGTHSSFAVVACSVTTSGRPTYLTMVTDGTLGAGLGSIDTTNSSDTSLSYFQIIQVQSTAVVGEASLELKITSVSQLTILGGFGNLTGLDLSAAGNYTWKLITKSNGSGASARILNGKLVGFEL